MERLRQTLKVRSHYIEALDINILFAFDVFTPNEEGLVVDANALQDPERSVAESVKMVYISAKKYYKSAMILGVEANTPPTQEQIAIFAEAFSDEFQEALKYIFTKITVEAEKKKLKG